MSKFSLDGNAAGAVKAVTDLGKAIDDLAKKGKVAADEAKKLDAAAKRIAENADPLQKYSRLIVELNQHFRAGRIDIDTATKAAKQYYDKFHEIAPVVKDVGKANDELASKTNRVSAAVKDLGDKGHSVFGGQLTDLAKMAAGFFTLEKAAELVKEALVATAEEAKRASEATIASLGGVATIEQAPGDKTANLALARSIQARGITKDFAQSADVVAGLRRGRVADADIETLLGAAENKQIAPGDLAAIGEKVTKIAEQTGGGFGATFSKISQAAKATNTTISGEAAGVTRFAARGQRMGFGLDEQLAAFAAIQRSAASPEEAANQERALFMAIEKKGLAKGTLEETIASLSAAEGRGNSAYDLLGSGKAAVPALHAFEKNRGVFESQLGGLRAAGGRGGLGTPLTETDARLAAAKLAEEATAKAKETFEAARSTPQSLLTALEGEEDTFYTGKGEGDISRFARQKGQYLGRTFAPTETLIETFEQRNKGGSGFHPSDALSGQILEYLKRTAKASEDFNKKLERRGTLRAE